MLSHECYVFEVHSGSFGCMYVIGRSHNIYPSAKYLNELDILEFTQIALFDHALAPRH